MIAFNAIHAEITWTLSDDGTLTISGTDMPDYGFYDSPWDSQREKIKKVVIEKGVTNIGNNAFYTCSALTSITIPNSVTSIGGGTFCACSSLTSITIPNSVTTIGLQAFMYCSSLTSITIPNSVTSIEAQAFCGCGLSSVTIPNSVTSIGLNAFYGCSGLTSITVPNSVTSIEAQAFYGCTGLTSITIPNSVKSIGNGAFEGCSGLTSIIVKKENKKYDSRDNCNAIIETESNTLIIGCKNTIIPNSVTSIGNHAFENCTGLTSITIPNSVISIGCGAFYNCSGIKEIYSWNTTPPSIVDIYAVRGSSTNPFSGMNTLHAKVFVPEGSGDAYRYAPYWMDFLNIYEMEYSPALSEAEPITISDNASTITKGYYKEKTLTYEREGNAIRKECYVSFCLPFAVNPVDAQFKAVYVPVGVALYNTETNTLRIGFYKSEEIIPAGTPFLAQLAVDDKVVIKNALPVNYNSNEPNVKKNVVRTFNYSDKGGLMSENNNYAINFSGTYKKISPTNTYTFNADGSVGLSANVSPFRAYVTIAKNSTNAKIVTSFDEDTELTGIMELIKPNVDLPVYDLNGRAVDENALKSGVYIKNGKKVIIK